MLEDSEYVNAKDFEASAKLDNFVSGNHSNVHGKNIICDVKCDLLGESKSKNAKSKIKISRSELVKIKKLAKNFEGY